MTDDDKNLENGEPRLDRPKIKVKSGSDRDQPSISPGDDDELPGSELEEPTTSPEYDPIKTKRSLRKWFVFTLVAGTLLILFPKFTGLQQIGLALILMLIYLFAGLKHIGIPTTRAVFADSIYYLGFLFTFIALVGSMLKLGQDSFDIETIIGQMGPALVTTVFGMAARIYLTQFEPITSEPEEEIFNSLGTLSSNLNTALDQLGNVTKQNAHIVKEFQNSASQQMMIFTEKLDQIDTSGVTEKFDKLVISMETLQNSWNGLSDSSGRTKLTIDETKQDLLGLTDSIADIKKKLSKAQEFSVDLNTLDEAVKHANFQMQEVSELATEKIQLASENLGTKISATSLKVDSQVALIEKELTKAESQTRQLNTTILRTVTDVVDFLARHK